MKRRTLLYTGLTALLIVVVLIFPIGGGFGAKADPSPLEATAVFAHRGGEHGFPENSQEGVQRCLRTGFPGVEVDIHFTSDGVPVLFHDDSCRRMLGISGRVFERTLDELRAQPLLIHGTPSASYIATLPEVLTHCGDSLLFYLDIKTSGMQHADSIAALIERMDLTARVLVASSSITFLTFLEFHHPRIHTVLEGFDRGEEWTWHLFPKNFRPDFVSSFAHEVDAPHAAWLKEHGLLHRAFAYGLKPGDRSRLTELGYSRFLVDDERP